MDPYPEWIVLDKAFKSLHTTTSSSWILSLQDVRDSDGYQVVERRLDPWEMVKIMEQKFDL